MAIQYYPLERMNPITKEKKWYAAPKLVGKKGLKEISRDIAELSSLSPGDVLNVISNFVDQLPKWAGEGNSVKLDGLGTFRLSFSSEGVSSKDEVTANLIKGMHIVFQADTDIKERINKAIVVPKK